MCKNSIAAQWQGRKWLIVSGNPIDGFAFYGPFDTREAAQDEATDYDDDWWTAELQPPANDAIAPTVVVESAGLIENGVVTRVVESPTRKYGIQ